MNSSIGRSLDGAPRSRTVAVSIAVGVATFDVVLRYFPYDATAVEARYALALLGFVGIVWSCGGDLTSLGLRRDPVQGWWYWVRMSLLIAAAVGGFIIVGLGAWLLAGNELPVYRIAPRDTFTAFLQFCVFAPIVEETLYRLVLCVPISSRFGPTAAIIVSGVVFGALHLVAGRASPENLVGGFFLAWAFLKSETILIPVILHSAGNFFAFAAQVAAWYWYAPT